jgi:hypothetical protein
MEGIDDIGKLRHLLSHIPPGRMYDNFGDSSIGTVEWGAAVTAGSTTVTETAPNLIIANTGVGTAGESYLPTYDTYGRFLILETYIEINNGEAAGDGERCDGYIGLWQDANNYVEWGPYRDTSEAINSRGYLKYNIAGAGETLVDADTTDLDNVARKYSIHVTGDMLYFYIDDVLITQLSFPRLNKYYVRLAAGTQNNTDIIDVRFTPLEINSYNKLLFNVFLQELAIQGGGDSIGSLMAELDNLLDFSRHPSSGYTAMDGTEVTLISVAAQDVAWRYNGGIIKTHNMQGGDDLLVRAYVIPRSGGSYNNPFKTWSLINAQTEDILLPSVPNQYGLKVTAQQTSSHGVDSAQADDGGAYTDETDEANNATANDMNLLPAAPAVNDGYYFGCNYPFGLLRLNIGTSGVATTMTLTWYYYNGSAWVALSNVTDGTSSFTAAPGNHDVTFTIPVDWTAVAINGVTAYYIYAKLTAYTAGGGPVSPLGTQAWCHLAVLHDQYDERR